MFEQGHVTRFPRSFPLYLHTASNQILEVGTAWERGYCNPALWKCTNLNVSQCRVKSFVGQESVDRAVSCAISESASDIYLA